MCEVTQHSPETHLLSLTMAMSSSRGAAVSCSCSLAMRSSCSFSRQASIMRVLYVASTTKYTDRGVILQWMRAIFPSHLITSVTSRCP
ncbi:hypothetical protein E2C01_031612 [Portunus trituberculatus]|uniref:Uncharacterized protein n=1 Tax=Portunus trituberculatus TaxID=210409 RepID=A0A5B7EYK5_PORTR|nr:hypothetical protein [Portunus trituberculatus]